MADRIIVQHAQAVQIGIENRDDPNRQMGHPGPVNLMALVHIHSSRADLNTNTIGALPGVPQ